MASEKNALDKQPYKNQKTKILPQGYKYSSKGLFTLYSNAHWKPIK